MRKKLATWKKVALISIGSILILVALTIYTVLGPFRSLFWNLPYLAGFLGPKNYLVLIVNNYELRPAGGFISAYAKVHISFGQISVQVFDSYDVPDPQPKVTPPYPFQKLIAQKDPFYAGMTFRDANFSPSFAKSAQDVLRYYNTAFPDERVDFVVSVDLHVIEEVLGHYKSLTVNDITYTKQNVFIQTQIQTKNVDIHNQSEVKGRKNNLKALGEALVSKIKSEPTQYSSILNVMHSELLQKHIQIYTEKGLESKFIALGWSGTVEPKHGADLLMVNTANIGGRKADRYVQKKVDYGVTLRQNRPSLARATLRLSHQGDYNIQSDIYQAYIRIYVPEGSQLVTPPTAGLESTEVGSDLGATYFADMIILKPEESVELTYEYLLPETITPQNYTLMIPKQAGTTDTLLTVTLRSPNDTSLIDAPLTEGAASLNTSNGHRVSLSPRENIATWSGQQNTDLIFATSLIPDTQSPIVLWQEFDGRSSINVRFHEEIDQLALENLENFTIRDQNYSNQRTDDIRVIFAKFADRDLWLNIVGVSAASLEKYTLTLRNIEDLSGNVIDPNPLTLTLVQR